MKKLSCLFTLCLLLGAFACSEEENDLSTPAFANLGDIDHFVFGSYYGRCLGNCTQTFKLKSGGLFADKVDRGYPEPGMGFEDKSLSKADIELATKLLAEFPAELLKEEGEILGCPDCADQGGFYLEIQIGKSAPQVWRIDTDDSQIPKYLSAYTAKVRKVVEELQQ
jgi:hypothetical protein